MARIDPKKLDARLEAERARLVKVLRRMADRLEAVPVSKLSGAVTILSGLIASVEQWAERLMRSPPDKDR